MVAVLHLVLSSKGDDALSSGHAGTVTEPTSLREPFALTANPSTMPFVVKTDTLRSNGASLLGPPAPIELGEVLSRFGRQVLRLDLAGQSNGHLDLLQVRGTVGADFQMSLESPSIPTGK
jgi:hypothetical protein